MSAGLTTYAVTTPGNSSHRFHPSESKRRCAGRHHRSACCMQPPWPRYSAGDVPQVGSTWTVCCRSSGTRRSDLGENPAQTRNGRWGPSVMLDLSRPSSRCSCLRKLSKPFLVELNADRCADHGALQETGRDNLEWEDAQRERCRRHRSRLGGVNDEHSEGVGAGCRSCTAQKSATRQRDPSRK